MNLNQENILDRLQRGVRSHSAQETEIIAQALASSIPEDKVLAFHGDLGAGKTTFIRGMAKAWGIVEAVTSPTFNLYTIYKGASRQLLHLDAYRLSDGSDLDALMIDDFLISPWCLAVEWPSRISESLPSDMWQLYLEIDANRAHTIRLET